MRPALTMGIVLAGLALTLVGCGHEEPAAAPPPVAVKVSEVIQRDVPVYVEAIGQTRGSTEIEIRARVEGFIQSVDYKEGSFVNKGDRLYTIDSAPFEASLAQARGQEAGAEAQLARARQDVLRYEPLVAKNAISRQEYETAVSLQKAAEAGVAAAKAATRNAEINLGYTKVLAPEPGLVGKTEVYPGTLVGRGQSTLLTQISQIDPIHVRFTIAERDYLRYARQGEKEGRRPEDKPKVDFDLVLDDGSVHPHKGFMAFVDRNVDARTGTILLEAAFPNPERILRPGQYARVRATVETRPGAFLVPQKSIQEIQGVYNVSVVDQAGTVETRMVTPAEKMGSLRVIESGLKAGDRVVVEGMQKVRPGMKVDAQVVPIEAGESET
ncbi:MAG: efflux RND transporter periplasmic adaptor subunit [Candidatus Polarisedimenticolia bacterium]